MLRLRQLPTIFLVVLICWLLAACNTPDGVAKFCSSAVVTLRTGDALFDDMKASCIREAKTRESFDAFTISDVEPAVCGSIGQQAAGLKAASKLLSDYFSALNELASFGSSKAGGEAKSLVAQVASQANLGATHQKALESVASFLTRAATSGYRQKQLTDDIVKVHADIKVVLDGLGEAIGVAYVQQLQDEEKKTASRYREYVLQHQGAADVVLVLESRWQNDRTNFAAKRKAALNYVAALDTLAKGNEDLAAHARSLKAKELPSLLSPCAAELESLVSAVQKVFF